MKGISAFHEAARDLPAEPRFSIDSQRTQSTSDHSAASDFAWDAQSGELRSRRRAREYEQSQRYPVNSSTHSRSTTSNSGGSNTNTRTTTSNSGGSSSTAVASDQPLVSELPGSQVPPTIPEKQPKIVRRTSVDQRSEHMSTATSAQDWEDTASHHTVSVDGDGGYPNHAPGSLSSEGKQWSSSEYDTSGLSQAEIRKLRKKGINPSLYAEMKAARKGKGKWVGPLVGNTFIG